VKGERTPTECEVLLRDEQTRTALNWMLCAAGCAWAVGCRVGALRNDFDSRFCILRPSWFRPGLA